MNWLRVKHLPRVSGPLDSNKACYYFIRFNADSILSNQF